VFTRKRKRSRVTADYQDLLDFFQVCQGFEGMFQQQLVEVGAFIFR